MSATVEQAVIIKDKNHSYVFTPQEANAAETETRMTVFCDGPRCAARSKDADKAPASVSWNKEEAEKDLSKLPEEFFGLLELCVDLTTGNKAWFCGPQCAKDFLTYTYVRPKSFREQQELLKNLQENQQPQIQPHLVGQTKVEITDGLSQGQKVDEAPQESEESWEGSKAILDADATGYPV